jgi:hypothetical protein
MWMEPGGVDWMVVASRQSRGGRKGSGTSGRAPSPPHEAAGGRAHTSTSQRATSTQHTHEVDDKTKGARPPARCPFHIEGAVGGGVAWALEVPRPRAANRRYFGAASAAKEGQEGQDLSCRGRFIAISGPGGVHHCRWWREVDDVLLEPQHVAPLPSLSIPHKRAAGVQQRRMKSLPPKGK